jgi:hypothetical protein
MTYLDDSASVSTFVVPESHNSGAVDVKFLNTLPLDWLNCQLDGFYQQACTGTRSFDIRVQMWGDEIYCAHGLGTGIRLDIALQDLRRFHDDCPGEIFFLRIASYYDDSDIDPAVVSPIINGILEPATYAFPSDFPMDTATMGDLRASGRCFAISSPWVEDGYSSGRVGWGTFSGDFNWGELDDGWKLYDHLRDLLKNSSGPFIVELQRASGDSPEKHAPRDFMLRDRDLFMRFMRDLQKDPVMLSKVVAVEVDCVTFDFVQSGMIMVLNAFKNCITPAKEAEFIEKIYEEIG